jgi:predicted nucleic acid-binding protein
VTRFVVDSSLTMAWYLEDEQDAYADATHAALIDGAEAIVPPLWPYEVANGFRMADGCPRSGRRGRIQSGEIPRVLALLAPLPIQVQAIAHERARGEVLALARQEGLTCYDAAYLELAMREGLPLASLDRQLREAAGRVGTPLFQV